MRRTYNYLSETDAFNLEKLLIKTIGRKDLGLGPLCNMTDGGDGASNRIWTEEQRKWHSEYYKVKHKGEGHPQYGTKNSEKTKKRKSEKAKLYWSNPKNKIIRKPTEGSNRKRSETQKGKKKHLDFSCKISKSWTPERRKRHSERMKEYNPGLIKINEQKAKPSALNKH